jgi:hypothetical protein
MAALGESQDCSRAARGWSRSLFLVLLLYDCKEASKIDWKLDEPEDEDEEVIMGETTMDDEWASGAPFALPHSTIYPNPKPSIP